MELGEALMGYHETETLVDYLVGLKYESLPAEVVEVAKSCLLNTVGVSLYASTLPWAVMARTFARETGRPGASSIWGAPDTTSEPAAALANGVAGHGIGFDDRIPSIGLHPGSSIIPAALAIAEASHASGQQLVTGVIAGYETAVRVARAAGGLRSGIASAAHKGVWGAVAAGAKILELDAERTLNAFGIAGMMASGISEYNQDAEHSMTKRLTGGWAAHNGVTAALLARTGFSGPWSVLEGKCGYFEVFSDEPGSVRAGVLTEGLGSKFGVLEREVKPYATWGGAHVVIDAISQLRREDPEFTAELVEEVSISGSARLITDRLTTRPRSIASGQSSLVFVTAMAFLHDLQNPDMWQPEALTEPVVLRLADRVRCQVDADLDKAARLDGTYGGVHVEVRLADGSVRRADIAHSRGTVGWPMSVDDVRAKFDSVTSRVLRDDQRADVRAMIDTIEGVDVAELGALLRGQVDRKV